MTILVTGGTGTLGRPVAQRLHAAGHEVRVLSRRARPAGDSFPYRSVAVDLRLGVGIDQAVADVDVVIHCATTLRGGDVEAARNLIDAARRAGSPHLVYISIVGVDRMPFGYYGSKLAVERLIEGSGLPWTILRATQFHDMIVRMWATQRWLPVTLALAGVSFQPIDVREIADRLVELAAGSPGGRVPDLGGPQVRTSSDLARAYMRATGRRRWVLPVPVPGATFAALRRGDHLAPERAVGRVTFEEFLEERFPRPARAGAGPRPQVG